MLYRPNYCCNCGERFERPEWSVWHSRRLCPLCETEYKGHDLFTRVVVGAGVILGIFGFSSILKPAEVNPSGVVEGRQFASPVRQKQDAGPPVAESSPRSIKQDIETPTAASAGNSVPSAAANNGQTTAVRKSSEEPAYFCGVTTKKGTPCSRRVKTKGKPCWQHTATMLE